MEATCQPGEYRAFSHHLGSIDFNNANTTCPAGVYFLIHSLVWINDAGRTRLKLGCIGLHNAHPLQPRDFPWPSRCPSGFTLGTTQYIPPLGSALQCTDTICLWKMEWQSFAISTSFFSALMGFCQTFFGSLCKPYFQSYKDCLRLVLRKCARLKEKTTIQTGFKGHLEISKNIKSRVTTTMHHT